MSVGWDAKWCPVSRITHPPWHAKDRFTGLPPEKLQNRSLLTKSRGRYMVEMMLTHNPINEIINI